LTTGAVAAITVVSVLVGIGAAVAAALYFTKRIPSCHPKCPCFKKKRDEDRSVATMGLVEELE
jgi:hypothetical protein